jgi:hypothetical protein
VFVWNVIPCRPFPVPHFRPRDRNGGRDDHGARETGHDQFGPLHPALQANPANVLVANPMKAGLGCPPRNMVRVGTSLV